MFYEDIKELPAGQFKRLTGVHKAVFEQMLEVVTTYKQSHRKHPSRGTPPKLSYADKILLLLMYYREYRTQFHIGMTYGIAESTVCEIIKEIESILIKDKRFHLPGKKALLQQATHLEVVVVDVTESPVERPQKNSEGTIPAKRSATPKRFR
jgi:Helix-turn-helix of DDE superfamily endonuclease